MSITSECRGYHPNGKKRHQFSDKGPYSQSYGFSSSHVCMWELVHKEGWTLKSWCFWTVVLEKTLESPLDNKEIKPVNLKEINPEYSLEGLMLKLKLQYFGADAKSWLFGKEPDDGKDWGQKEKGVTEDEMTGWHQRLNEHKFQQTLGDGEGQGRLVCCFYRVAKSQTWLSGWTAAARTAKLAWITLLCKVSQPICTWSRQLSHKCVLWATRPICDRLWVNQ